MSDTHLSATLEPQSDTAMLHDGERADEVAEQIEPTYVAAPEVDEEAKVEGAHSAEPPAEPASKADGESLHSEGDESESEDEFSDPTEAPDDDEEEVKADAETAEAATDGEQTAVEGHEMPLDQVEDAQPDAADVNQDGKGGAIPAPLNLNGNGKGKEVASGSKPATPVSARSTASLAPQIRYALPIGGSNRLRPQTSPRVSSLNNGAGPSYLDTNRMRAIAKFEKMIEEDEQERQQTESTRFTPIQFSLTQDGAYPNRPAPPRRLSSSDIPALDVASTSEVPLEASPSSAILSLRRRSNTLAERGEKHRRPRTAPAKAVLTAAGGEDEREDESDDGPKRKDLKRLDTSTMMVDGQMFFLDEDPMAKKGKRAQSLAKGNTSAEGMGRRGSKSGGRRLLNRAADLGDMSFLSKAMRKPTKARDEPMIYDADELDDVPPPGAYAIHPPSQTKLQEAANLSLFDEEGNLVRFGTIFESQRTLIIFLRHWLCPFCQMFAQSIKNIDPLPLQRADLGLVVVGQGHAHVTKSYKQVMKIPAYVRVFSDPTRKIYQALGMTLRTNDAGPACARPEYQTMGVMKASFKAIKHGLVDMPVRLPGDVKLLGGEFILGPGLDCSFTHRMVTVRGHLDLPRILVQAGCDMSLKTPKDLLLDNDGASASGRPGSTRSVDRIGARRLARRLARKTHAATPKDILLMKSQRAAKTAAQRGSLNRRARASYDGTSVDGVDGRRHTAPRTYDDLDGFDKGRPGLPQAMHRGFSVGGRPQTSSSLPSSTVSRWTQEPARSYTATSRAPPLPRTSSADAFQAAKLRRQFFINEGMEELYDEEFDGTAGGRRGSMVREMRKRFTDPSAGNLSTASLGRSTSHRTQYQREQQRRQAELNELLNRSAFGGVGGLNALQQGGLAYRTSLQSSASDASLRSDSERSTPSDLPHRRTPSTQSLPLSSVLNRSSGTLGSKKALVLPPTSSDDLGRRRSQGLPLSVFQNARRIDPSYSSVKAAVPRVQVFNGDADRGAESRSPMSASFGEDTDYKRLPRSAFEPPTQASVPQDADETTPTSRMKDLPAVDSPNPPPVPPKSPPKSPLAARAPPPSIASRAPAPAPTPLFAAILAAENARLQAAAGAETTTARAKTVGGPSPAASVPVSPTTSAMPALLAGLPSLSSSSSTRSKSNATTPTQATFSALDGRQPISNYVRSPRAEGQSPRITIEESLVAAPDSAYMANQQSGTSFLDDLETVDGFKRQSGMSTSNDSALLKSPLTNRSSMGDTSRTDNEDDDEDDGVYYSNDWEPLHARQNVIPKGLKSPVEPELRPLSFASSNGGANRRSEEIADSSNEDLSPDDDDESLSEDDTEGEERDLNPPATLALLGVLSNGAKRPSASGDAVVKRVISRPNSAPTSPTSPTSNGSARGMMSGTLSGSARLVSLNRLPRKPPQSAGAIPLTSSIRTLTSFAEEEEEEGGSNGGEPADSNEGEKSSSAVHA